MASWIIILFLVSVMLTAIQQRFLSAGSDHYIHLAYIDSIRANNHRFITKVDSFINEDDFPDPQLYHWILSFFPRQFVVSKCGYFNQLINCIMLGSFFVFCYYLHPYLATSLTVTQFTRNAGLIFVFTPFYFYRWNAKNVGLSARGLGLLLGQLFLSALCLYLLNDNPVFLLISLLFAFLGLLSSQFAFQMVIFFSVIASIVFSQYVLAIVPLLAILISLLLLRTKAIIFFKRQFQYKKVYHKLFAPKFLFTARYSIWRDFIRDFWRCFYDKNLLRSFEYIYRNPVISILVGIPSLTVAIFLCLSEFSNSKQLFLILPLTHLCTILIIGLLIFLITSFRPTRFLGEPERYLEFFVPFSTVLATVLIGNNSSILMSIFLISLSVIFIEIFLIEYLATKERGISIQKQVSKLVLYLDKFAPPHLNRVLSNNYEILKYFAGKRYKILNANVTSEFTGPFHYNDLFPDKHGRISKELISEVIEKFGINWFVLDTNLLSKSDLLRKTNPSTFREIIQVDNLTLFKICSEA